VRSISATRVYTLNGPPVENGIIHLDSNGYIEGISASSGKTQKHEKCEFFEGALIPGFVNAHCHLELSHLKGCIPQKKGLGNFIGEISRLRSASDPVILQAAQAAENEMFRNGIAAVGDISNTVVTLEIKKQSEISWFTFVETFGFMPSRAPKAIGIALSVNALFQSHGLRSSVVPHSPYSVSDELFTEIAKLERNECSILSLHNQESNAENRFFLTGKGPILRHLQHNLGLDTSSWKPSGKNSLETILPKLNATLPLLLVHNTCTTLKDLEFLKEFRGNRNTWLVLCPNSNLFIGNKLPPVNLFRSQHMKICIGTDSLASNTALSILEELKTIQNYFPEIPTEELFEWACLNGAKALGMDDRLGSLETGKKPGIVWVRSLNPGNGYLTPESRVERIA
jgi:aminodeoxyfutalosine deaminase